MAVTVVMLPPLQGPATYFSGRLHELVVRCRCVCIGPSRAIDGNRQPCHCSPLRCDNRIHSRRDCHTGSWDDDDTSILHRIASPPLDSRLGPTHRHGERLGKGSGDLFCSNSSRIDFVATVAKIQGFRCSMFDNNAGTRQGRMARCV